MDFVGRVHRWTADVGADVKYSTRTLFRSNSFLVAIVSLALGLGATTAVYSNIDWLLGRPPGGVFEPERLVWVGQSYASRPEFGAFGMVPEQLDRFQEVQDGFTGTTASAKYIGVISTDLISDQVTLEFVEGSYFVLLGLRPAIGRLIGPEDDVEGAPTVAVLSHQFWSSAFGADPGILDRSIRLNGQDARIVGVLPSEFEGFRLDAWGRSSVIVPIESGAGLGAEGYLRGGTLTVVGRMNPGVSLEALRQRAGVWFQELPALDRPLGPTIPTLTPLIETRLAEQNRSRAREFLGSLLVVCALVLIGACFNVANVFLGRASARRRELAMRAALGAGPGRLARQMITEAVLVGATAGGLSLVAGALIARLLSPLPLNYLELLSTDLPLSTTGAFDTQTMWVTLGLALVCVAAFGLLPAIMASLRAPATVLKKETALWSWSGIQFSPRQVVLVLQIGLSVAIGIVAGVYSRSFLRIVTVEHEFADPGSVLIAGILPPRGLTEDERGRFYREVGAGLEALPQVESFSVGWNLPRRQGFNLYSVPEDENRRTEAGTTGVTPRFFETQGLPMIAGREFTEWWEDGDGLVVNRTLAEFLWPNEDPIGKTVLRGFEDPIEYRVIGVAAYERCRDLLGGPSPCAWLPFRALTSGIARVRTRGDPLALVNSIRDVVREIHLDGAVTAPTTLEAHIRQDTGAARTAAAASSVLAGLALLLVAVGSVSLFLAMVRGSVREIAIRMALGAGSRQLGTRIMTQGLALAGAGIVVGLLLASFASRRLVGQLYEVGAHDPVTYVMVPLLVFVIGLGSVGYAAAVAIRTEPMKNLQAT